MTKKTSNFYLSIENIDFIKNNGSSKELDKLLSYMKKNKISPKNLIKILESKKTHLNLRNLVINLGEELGIIIEK